MIAAEHPSQRPKTRPTFLRLVHIPFIPSLSISFLSPLAPSTSLETDERDMENIV